MKDICKCPDLLTKTDNNILSAISSDLFREVSLFVYQSETSQMKGHTISTESILRK
jgi:hypothetical protein